MTIALEWREQDLADTVAVLNVINPHGYTAERIKAETVRTLTENPSVRYWGTAGFYVLLYERAGHAPTDSLECMTVLMPFVVRGYLESQREILSASDHSRMAVKPDLVERVISGRVTELLDAFTWRHSPQGARYWGERYAGVSELSEEDVAFLKTLLVPRA